MKKLVLFVLLLFVIALLFGCAGTKPAVTKPTSKIDPKVCMDDCTKKYSNPQKCSLDCNFPLPDLNQQGQNPPILNKPDQNVPPVGEKLCGDGVCDEFEKSSGQCPKDCQGGTTVTTAGNMSIGNIIHLKDESGNNLVGSRPEVGIVGNNVVLLYNGGNVLNEILLDKNMNSVSNVNSLFPGTVFDPERLTDIRTVLADGKLFYAFEKMERFISVDCNGNALNAVLYNISENELSLVSTTSDVAYGCPMGIALMNVGCSPQERANGCTNTVSGSISEKDFAGKEATDDPTPFYLNGTYYILTRINYGNYAVVRSFDSQMNLLSEKHLDLSAVLVSPEYTLNQNSLVRINNHNYLIAGISNGPPNGTAESKIYEIPLSDDLSTVSGTPQVLAYRQGEYSTASKSSKLIGNNLFVVYEVLNDAKHGVYVEEFDTTQNFRSLGRILVESAKIADNHTPLVVVDGSIYAFYEYSDNSIIAKKILSN